MKLRILLTAVLTLAASLLHAADRKLVMIGVADSFDFEYVVALSEDIKLGVEPVQHAHH